jgi:hypothetical protein
MDPEDFVKSEVAVAVAATVGVLSPRVRGVLRRGAVYGVAGLLLAGDVVGGAAGPVIVDDQACRARHHPRATGTATRGVVVATLAPPSCLVRTSAQHSVRSTGGLYNE